VDTGGIALSGNILRDTLRDKGNHHRLGQGPALEDHVRGDDAQGKHQVCIRIRQQPVQGLFYAGRGIAARELHGLRVPDPEFALGKGSDLFAEQGRCSPVPGRVAFGDDAHPVNRQIPGKIYEYIRARKPVLSLVDMRGDTAQLLKTLGVDTHAKIDDAEDIARELGRFVTLLEKGQAPVASEEDVLRYSRHHKAVELAQLLDSIQ